MKCSVSDCSNEAFARTWCRKHYMRWWSHGNVDIVKKKMPTPGAVAGYFEFALAYTGSDCLIWAYSDNGVGYGLMQINGQRVLVSRVICERTHGPAPSDDHHAAHRCGNGHLGCVTPRHLRWATPIENRADTVLHGTEVRGEFHHNAKLTDAEAREIFRRVSAGEVQHLIASDFDISQTIVSRIKRKGWGSFRGAEA